MRPFEALSVSERTAFNSSTYLFRTSTLCVNVLAAPTLAPPFLSLPFPTFRPYIAVHICEAARSSGRASDNALGSDLADGGRLSRVVGKTAPIKRMTHVTASCDWPINLQQPPPPSPPFRLKQLLYDYSVFARLLHGVHWRDAQVSCVVRGRCGGFGVIH